MSQAEAAVQEHETVGDYDETVREHDTTRRGSARAPWRIGTRGSLLALTQAGTVRDALIAAGEQAELVIVKTAGDKSSDPVQKIGVGVFTTALRDELASGAVDIAVHSYKDLPTAPDPRFVIAAIPPREDPRDALVARDGLVLGELPPGARIGTSAPRRVAQLRALGLGLDIRPLRGNIDTRLRKVAEGELDAVVLARAGLARIGRLDAVTEALEPVQMLPAPSQGALAVECRREDTALITLLTGLDDAGTRAAVVAERALLAELEAGCTAPVGALAEVVESLDDDGRVFEELSLRGCAAAIDGSDVIRASAVGSLAEAEQLGRALARELLELGARDLLSADDSAADSVAADGSSTPTGNPSTSFSNPSPMENNQ
ncbi:hydroxymethylbilane synthase [Nocardia terpenica]|uniref:hydroxymethylbilane synthase n=1 Tax=Nocardia terpenica TaxID=455432 RepID=UPI0009EDC679|nr:hydroxymethylbilane synthase [Nocardia terpenica]MBF6060140.1 hydroxymethylbilane synthase [Nocardia terpenica]MBF6103400.1 hydroxymethylbilane synthase [Nocardia terpenica]MBF6112226.1 hydroxymethylbilane synthase [Nocardia terpenica]MBF6117621.1 hydroxymethylbilane synthase [Nocardia terpenica]MBF6153635.1 hydroxymethylbilane synthase [Nocardia terpenica]